ncbi:Muscarinic acetylcholine receptor gar-3 [Trichinella sp. T8]|nr:Muscarinic acetylcholine receptor gar-3 [Trichinella sp. T8]
MLDRFLCCYSWLNFNFQMTDDSGEMLRFLISVLDELEKLSDEDDNLNVTNVVDRGKAVPVEAVVGNSTQLAFSTLLESPPHGLAAFLAIVIVGFVLSLVTTGGNVLVIMSFKMDKQLQTINNYFLLSLAVADLVVGCVSIPLMTVYTASGSWPLGYEVCQLWLNIDYLVSNTSVLNLLLISFDRYLSVTRPLTYRPRRTRVKAIVMITSTFIISLLIWPPWIIAWPYIEGKFIPAGTCIVQFLITNPYVTLGTACAAFYVPVTIMVILYAQVYNVTKRRSEEIKKLQGFHKKSMCFIRGNRATAQLQFHSHHRNPPSHHSNHNHHRHHCHLQLQSSLEHPTTAPVQLPPSVIIQTSGICEPQHQQTSQNAHYCDQSVPKSAAPSSPRLGKRIRYFLKQSKRECQLSKNSTRRYSHPENRRLLKMSSSYVENERRSFNPPPLHQPVLGKVFSEGEHCQLAYPSFANISSSGMSSCESEDGFSFGKSDVLEMMAELEKRSEDNDVDDEQSCDEVEIVGESAEVDADIEIVDETLPKHQQLDEQHQQRLDQEQLEQLEHEQQRIFLPKQHRSSTFSIKTEQKSSLTDGVGSTGYPASPSRPTLSHMIPSFLTMTIGGSTGANIRSKLMKLNQNIRFAAKLRRSESKAAKMLSVILLAFIVTWTPYNVIVLIEAFFPQTVPSYFFKLSYYLCYLNSTINPLCYALCNRAFRRTYIRILTSRWYKEPRPKFKFHQGIFSR